jgi:gluconokinase
MGATCVLALDVGTSSVRALVYDDRGQPLQHAEAQTPYDPTHGFDARPGFDADELAAAAAAAIDEARREAGGSIAAVAASCFWHSLVAVGRDGLPLTPLSTWRDLRSTAEAEELAQRLDRDAVHRRTGCPLHPSFWPSKLLWLKRNEPTTFRAARRFLSFSDYLYLRLLGDDRTTLSMASATGFLDASGGWDAELLDAVGVEAERLPVVSDEPVEADVPWFRALGDGACSNVGAGCLGPGRAVLMIGTSGALRSVYEAAEPTARPGLFLYRLDERRVVEGGSISDGGNLYVWLTRLLSSVDPEGLADAPPAAHGLTFLTLLGGERSPGWNARLRGAVEGLSFDTVPRDLVQAALEGVAFRFAEIADRMPEAHELVGSGGALAHNRDWAQIVADVLERPLTLSAVEEASARGAAVVALERLGASPDPAPLGRTFEPRADRATTYRLARERQRALYDDLVRHAGQDDTH